MKDLPVLFEEHKIRRLYDEKTETWWFSVVDIIQVLTEQADFKTARKYWNKLKERLGKEGSQLVTNCHRLKLPAVDGRMRLTDVASAENSPPSGPERPQSQGRAHQALAGQGRVRAHPGDDRSRPGYRPCPRDVAEART